MLPEGLLTLFMRCMLKNIDIASAQPISSYGFCTGEMYGCHVLASDGHARSAEQHCELWRCYSAFYRSPLQRQLQPTFTVEAVLAPNILDRDISRARFPFEAGSITAVRHHSATEMSNQACLPPVSYCYMGRDELAGHVDLCLGIMQPLW